MLKKAREAERESVPIHGADRQSRGQAIGLAGVVSAAEMKMGMPSFVLCTILFKLLWHENHRYLI